MHKKLTLDVADGITVSAIATVPARPLACLVFAHGAGAGMNHPYIESVCRGFVERRVATLRYQFPYMQRGLRRPDSPPLCHAAVRAATVAAHDLLPKAPLFAGGKSFGGRMTSQAQALAPLAHVRGLCFFGFPLHMPNKPSISRAEHLTSIEVPMLFLQGSRDALAEPTLLRRALKGLPSSITLKVIEHADHSFHVLVRSGTTAHQVMESMLDEATLWMRDLSKRPAPGVTRSKNARPKTRARAAR